MSIDQKYTLPCSSYDWITAYSAQVLDGLFAIANDDELNAHILLYCLQSFYIIVSLIVVEHFLSYTNSLSVALQK